MTAPDPKTVREIAREYTLDQAKYWNAKEIRQKYRADLRCAQLDDEDFTDLRDAVINAVASATVTVEWPDEQQPAETTGGEQVRDGRPLIERLPPEDAERVAALIDERDCWRKEVLDLRAVLAERKALAARVAELESEREQLWAERDGLRAAWREHLREIGALAADAAPDGRSATETVEQRSEAHGVELEFGKGAAGLSGRCRATKLDDGIRHHCDNDSGDPHTHECGDCAHRWDDNTTEDSGA